MRPIISEITSLFQYLKLFREDPHQFRPDRCPHCKSVGRLNYHGIYYRKPDRENPSRSNLNPIPITRFYCTVCRRTCSVLPNCIAPHRWYMWEIQEEALKDIVLDSSFRKISKIITPSRRTIARWWYRLLECYPKHHLHLCSRFSWLGYSDDIKMFWRHLLAKMDLSVAMFALNEADVFVP